MLKLKEDTVITAGILRELCHEATGSVVASALYAALDKALEPEPKTPGQLAFEAYYSYANGRDDCGDGWSDISGIRRDRWERTAAVLAARSK